MNYSQVNFLFYKSHAQWNNFTACRSHHNHLLCFQTNRGLTAHVTIYHSWLLTRFLFEESCALCYITWLLIFYGTHCSGGFRGGAAGTHPPPPLNVDLHIVFCIILLKNKAQIARESMKNLEFPVDPGRDRRCTSRSWFVCTHIIFCTPPPPITILDLPLYCIIMVIFQLANFGFFLSDVDDQDFWTELKEIWSLDQFPKAYLAFILKQSHITCCNVREKNHIQFRF